MDPAALAAMFGAGAGGGGGGGLSREQAAMFAQMMSGMSGAAGAGGGGLGAGGMAMPHPAHAPAAPSREPTPEELEAEKEKYIQEYAKYLDELKTRDPEEYREIMTELANAARQAKAGFEPVMPGGERKMGSGGTVDSVKPEEGVEVTPEPGFVIKTTNAGGVKVFINVCKSTHIKPPSKKKQLQPDGTEQEGMNIPLSLGPPNTLTTKKGDKAIAFDCIVNDQVIADSAADRTGSYRHFLCELCIQYVEQKYKTQLNHQYKLPQSKYKGKVQTQWVRKKQAPVIEEVEDTETAAQPRRKPRKASRSGVGSKGAAARQRGKAARGGRATAAPAPVIRVKEPDEHAKYSVTCRDGPDGEPYTWADAENASPTHLLITVKLDKMPDDETPAVDVAEELVVLKATGYFPLEIYLPAPVDADAESVSASLDRQTSTLTITLPIMDVNGRVHPDPGSKPWLLSRALASGAPDTESTPGGGARAPAVSSSTAYGASGAPVAEDDVLPEDRFHKTDIVSQHLLMERAKERAERKKKQAEKDAREAKEKAQKEAEEQAKKEAEAVAAREAAIAAAVADDDLASGDLELSTSMALDLID